MRRNLEYIIQETVDEHTRTLKTVSADNETVILGRSDEADITFAENDRTVSRKQFRLVWEKNRAYLENLGRASVSLDGGRAKNLLPEKRMCLKDDLVACFEKTSLHISRKRCFSKCHLIFQTDSGIKTSKLNTNISYRIGRADDNDIQLSAASVSAHHCTIFPSPDGKLRLTDLNSRNGIKVQDGETIRPLNEGCTLESGSSFFMGDVLVRILFKEGLPPAKKHLMISGGVLALILCVGLLFSGESKPTSFSRKADVISSALSILSQDVSCLPKGRALSSLADASVDLDKDALLFCSKCAELYLEFGRIENLITYEQEAGSVVRNNISRDPWSLAGYRFSSGAEDIQNGISRCIQLLKEVEELSNPLKISLDSIQPSMSSLLKSIKDRSTGQEQFRENCEQLCRLVQAAQKDVFTFIERDADEASRFYLQICPGDQRFVGDLNSISKLCRGWKQEEDQLISQIEEWGRQYTRKGLFSGTSGVTKLSVIENQSPLHFPEAPLPTTSVKAVHQMLTRLSLCRSDLDVMSVCESLNQRSDLTSHDRAQQTLSAIRSRALSRISVQMDNMAEQAGLILSGSLADSAAFEESMVKLLGDLQKYDQSPIRKAFPKKYDVLVEHQKRLVTEVLSSARELYTQATVSSPAKTKTLARRLKALSEQMLEVLGHGRDFSTQHQKAFRKLKARAESMIAQPFDS